MTAPVATLRAATQAELVEGLERNPGSGVLRERGWAPAWFEVEIDDERQFSLIWIEPGRDARDAAREELGYVAEAEGLDADDFELRVAL